MNINSESFFISNVDHIKIKAGSDKFLYMNFYNLQECVDGFIRFSNIFHEDVDRIVYYGEPSNRYFVKMFTLKDAKRLIKLDKL